MRAPVKVLRADDVRAVLDMSSCIDACERAFVAYSTGAVALPDVIHLDVPESSGEVHVKAGYVLGEPHYAVKIASGFVSPTGEPIVDGMVLVFDARSGAPVAFLLDDGYLTDLRTGAAGGVAARHLAPARVATVAVIGTGAQASRQLEALAAVRPGFERVRVWGRTQDHVRGRVARILADHGEIDVVACSSVREAVEGADVVITCTAARESLVIDDWLEPGVHVTAVGSDGPGKQELDRGVLAAADLVVADSRDQCARLGELQHSPDQLARTVELGEICAGLRRGREDPAQKTVCDLTGLGVQDVAAAALVMARAGDRGEVIDV
ncbi:MAG TPA: ornithine cyclodeaminase family protein [Actinomycetota bacterium]|nr:ornithine cyclodeaminase family protein [Actinomycetota bacterium]